MDDKTQALIDSFRPTTLDTCETLRDAFPNMTDHDFIGHLNHLGTPRAVDLMVAVRGRKLRRAGTL